MQSLEFLRSNVSLLKLGKDISEKCQISDTSVSEHKKHHIYDSQLSFINIILEFLNIMV